MTATAPGTRGPSALPALRSATGPSHARLEAALDLTSPHLTIERLGVVIGGMAHFWAAAEQGLDVWALASPLRDRLQWQSRRRAHLFFRDAQRLGAQVPSARPTLAAVGSDAAALGRLYVLEGATLGGQVLTRSFADRPAADPVSSVRLPCLSPYGERTGTMWHAFRALVSDWAAQGGDVDAACLAAVATFGALEDSCAGVAA